MRKNKSDQIEQLEEYINLASTALQSGFLGEMMKRSSAGHGNPAFDYPKDDREVYRWLEEFWSDAPSIFRDFIFNDLLSEPFDNHEESLYQEVVLKVRAEQRIEELVTACRVLNLIAFNNMIQREDASDNYFKLDRHRLNEWLNQASFFEETEHLPLEVFVMVDVKWRLKLKTNLFFKFLVNNDVDASRIRSCLDCRKLFWAYRKDKWTCSKQCANRWRQENYLSENREIVNKKRRKNYAYSKKKLKVKNGGTNGSL